MEHCQHYAIKFIFQKDDSFDVLGQLHCDEGTSEESRFRVDSSIVESVEQALAELSRSLETQVCARHLVPCELITYL